MPFFLRWIVTTISVAVACSLTGMHADSILALAGTALFLGIINALVRPILLFLSVPLIVVTLGFFILVVNAFTLSLAGALVPGFHVGGFWHAFFGSMIIGVVNWSLSLLYSGNGVRRQVATGSSEMKRVSGRIVE